MDINMSNETRGSAGVDVRAVNFFHDPKRKEEEDKKRRTWPDGTPDKIESGEWYRYFSGGDDSKPPKRAMWLGEMFDPYCGPVYAEITETGSALRWEVGGAWPMGPGDEPFDAYDVGYCPTLLEAVDAAAASAIEYLELGWPEVAAKMYQEAAWRVKS